MKRWGRRGVTAILLAAVLLAAVPAAAGFLLAAQDENAPRFRVSVRLVRMLASAQRQEIDLLQRATQIPDGI